MTQNEQPKEIDAADLPLAVSGDGGTPHYLQLANQLQALIDSRTLRAGIKLPSSRELALALGLNRNTVGATFEWAPPIRAHCTSRYGGARVGKRAGTCPVATMVIPGGAPRYAHRSPCISAEP